MNFWHARSTREKIMLLVVGALLVIFVLYNLLLGPLNSHLNNAKSTYASNKDNYGWLQHAAAKIKAAEAAGIQLSGSNNNASGVPALVTVQSAISTSGLQQYITNSAQNAKQVSIDFKACPFDKLMGVVATLSHQNIKVLSMTTIGGAKLGTSSGNIVFVSSSS